MDMQMVQHLATFIVRRHSHDSIEKKLILSWRKCHYVYVRACRAIVIPKNSRYCQEG